MKVKKDYKKLNAKKKNFKKIMCINLILIQNKETKKIENEQNNFKKLILKIYIC